MKDKFDSISKIITLIFSFIAIIISIIALLVNHDNYNINKEKFVIDSTENLTISIDSKSFDSIVLKLNENDEKPSYRIKTTICFVNNSNLPIYINEEYISRKQYLNGNYGTEILDTTIDIEELKLPILIEPQKTKFVDCYMRITIPQHINQYIIDEFKDTSNLNIEEIGSYLFFEKHTDLVGNEIETFIKDGVTHFKYNPTILFQLSFCTTKGNYFSTEFYDGIYFDKNYTIDENIDFSIGFLSGKKTIKEEFFNFVINNLYIILLVITIMIFFKHIALRKISKRNNSKNQLRKKIEKIENKKSISDTIK